MKQHLRLGVILLAAVAAFAITLALGRWQLNRAAQKEALYAAMQVQGAKPALDARAVLGAADAAALVHQNAVLSGTWVPEKTVFLDNRQMNARVGFFVLTPLVLQDTGAAIMVQRGWVPRNFENRTSLPTVHTPAGVVQVSGRIAPAPSKLYQLGTAAAGPIRQNLDLAQFKSETALPLLNITLQQTGAPSEGLLRDWPAVNLGVEKHYGYAFQWFGLSTLIVMLTVWFQFIRRFVYPRKDSSPHG
jgi:surfeit locus 1 family protein